MQDITSKRNKLVAFRRESTKMDNFEKIMENNREWAESMISEDS